MKLGGKTGFRVKGVAAILGALVLGLALTAQGELAPKAPDFALRDLKGNLVTLGQFRDRIVLLDFWATWCPPCRKAIPELVSLQTQYRAKGLQVLGISLDDPALVRDADLRAFARKYRINYPVLRITPPVMQAYFGPKPPPIPTLFLIDRQGRILNHFVGFSPAALRGALEKALESKPKM